MPRKKKTPLSRDRVLAAAIELADRDGLDALSMRRLGQQLGVEAMSLYNHVANKDDILDAIVDIVVAEIDVSPPGTDWKAAMRGRAISAHEVLLRHPWASALIESRTNIGPNRLRYFDSMVGIMREAGFPIAAAYRAFITLDSYVYGFTLQELSWPFEKDQRADAVAEMSPQVPADEYRYLMEMMAFVMGADADADAGTAASGSSPYGSEFEFGLDLILDGLERLPRDDS